ncbi:hypothetical protein D0T25_06720 [Duganella sp. BJB488]|uniref:hypothetical protein n=1 Tax=unclassified Duganella TaxID=2636909 RepID=UPI000E34804C|nr:MULTISPECIES: hypothetical protein [unclassified Duganella]RFP23176.1 hypothetical protein D0T26_09130 [Duganella sp. BJB489]RFP24748.1 hypothetical protein D0T25_06720 [Duganella sp. BJB488]RFP34174.1 hypothetical protein D0T24_17510 [Duganella sp. BJB480]
MTITNAADQAAATMRAEFAQQYADAERSVDVKKSAPPAPLVVLSEEVTFLARQLRQPPELVAQLLVLAEVRGMRDELNQRAFAAQLRTAHLL